MFVEKKDGFSIGAVTIKQRFELIISIGLLDIKELKRFCLIQTSSKLTPEDEFIIKKVACIYWNVDINSINFSVLLKNLRPLKRYILLSGLIPYKVNCFFR